MLSAWFYFLNICCTVIESLKEQNISIYFFFFHPSLNGVQFPMSSLLVEGSVKF